MINSKFILFLFFALICISCSQTVDLETGRIIICKHCHTVILKSTSFKKVKEEDAKKNRVYTIQRYCSICGEEEVSYKVTYECCNCGKTYDENHLAAKRKVEKVDTVISNLQCNVCLLEVKLKYYVDNANEDDPIY